MAIKYLKYLLPTDVFNVLVWKAMHGYRQAYNCRVRNVWYYIPEWLCSLNVKCLLINTGNVGLQKFLWALSYVGRFYENFEIDAAKHGQ